LQIKQRQKEEEVAMHIVDT
jgi:hypothetical protein